MKNAVSIFMVLIIGVCATSCSSLRYEDVSWNSSDGIELEGTVLIPKAEVKGLVILIHGSGNIHRGLKWYEIQAKKFAEMNLAVLYYDKRGTGSSRGQWKDVGLDQLAEDALAAIPKLRNIPNLKHVQVGLVGYSQGGWIMLKAMERDKGITFLISVSGSTQTPGEQGKYVARFHMNQDGMPNEKLSLADSLNDMVNQVYLSNSGWEEAREVLDNHTDEGLGQYGIGLMPRESWNWKWYADLPLDYNPRPSLEKLDIPLLALHGAQDPLVDANLNHNYLEQLRMKGLDIQNYMDSDGRHILRYRKKHFIFWHRSYWKDEYYETISKWLVEKDFTEPD